MLHIACQPQIGQIAGLTCCMSHVTITTAFSRCGGSERVSSSVEASRPDGHVDQVVACSASDADADTAVRENERV